MAATRQWLQVLPTGDAPLGRSSTACAVISGKLYVFSGEHVPRVPIDNHLNIFDFASNEWQVLSPQSEDESKAWPVARVGHFGTSCQGKFFIFGGRTAYNHLETLDDFWQFDPDSRLWARIEVEADAAKPSALSYHAMTSADDHIYVFGGCFSKGRSNELWEYSLSTSQWQRIECDPSMAISCRGGPGLACLNNQIHILFGFDGKNALGDHFVFDRATKNWQNLTNESAPAPPARSVTGVVALPALGARGSLFVFGGESAASAQGHEGAGKYLQDTWIYDLASQSWSVHLASAALPSARGWLSTIALDDGQRAVIYGGFDGEERVGDLWLFSNQ